MHIVVVGGGLVGTCFALEAHDRGARVTIVERTGLHAEASTAGAGILGADAESLTGDHVAHEAIAAREAMFAWLPALEARSGLPARAARRGTLVLPRSESERAQYTRWLAAHPASGAWIDPDALAELQPALARRPLGAVHFEADGALEPARYGSAVAAALRATSVDVRCGLGVAAVIAERGGARGVQLDDGSEVRGDAVVIAAGAWSRPLLERLGIDDPIAPLRGQLLELRPTRDDVRPVIFEGKRYIVPRGDGRFVVGSTMEHVGFDRHVTEEARDELIAFAERVVPGFAGAERAAHWCGFRPYRAGGPRVGATPVPGLFTSFGHGRDGILFSRKSALDLADALAIPRLSGD
jgi:glycine oxidase